MALIAVSISMEVVVFFATYLANNSIKFTGESSCHWRRGGGTVVGSVLVFFGDGADGGVDELLEAGLMVTAVSVDVEGLGGVLGRGESSRSDTAALSLNNSASQCRFLIHLACDGFTEGGEGAGGGFWCEVDGGGW
jgi:hypothetical protein